MRFVGCKVHDLVTESCKRALRTQKKERYEEKN